MIVGVPREIKAGEQRVALTPAGAQALVESGHRVVVETGAGAGSGIRDDEYAAVGAELAAVDDVWRQAEMILKVKEPLAEEIRRIRPGQIVFTYFHFAASRELTEGMIASGAVALAYETVEEEDGGLPLLVPMSEVAGRMAVQEGAKYLEKLSGGRGILLGGVPGTPPGEVVILGGGVVGTNAAKMAAGLGARVTILDISLERLRYLEDVMPANVDCVFSDVHTIREMLGRADLLIGAVLLAGAKAPNLVTRADLALMKDGAVIVDVAVDQGGCFETTHATTHSDPVYEVDGVVHYCVANMPGAVPRTSTFALNNATLPYTLELADKGAERALREDPDLLNGLNTYKGRITCAPVAESQGRDFADPAGLM